jgi:hypothetical protein
MPGKVTINDVAYADGVISDLAISFARFDRTSPQLSHHWADVDNAVFLRR